MSFEDELRKVFIEEVTQLIQDAEQCFLALERTPDDSGIIDKIFRIAHNIKGGSKAVGFDGLGIFAHEFENLLLRIKNREISVSEPSINLMLKCNDRIKYMVDQLKNDIAAQFSNEDLIGEIKDFVAQALNPPTPVETHDHVTDLFAPSHKKEVVDFTQPAFTPSATEEHAVLDPTEDFTAHVNLQVAVASSAVVPAAHANANAGVNANANVVPAKTDGTKQIAKTDAAKPAAKTTGGLEDSIRVSTARLEKLLNYIGEMVILQSVLNEQSLGNDPHRMRKTVQEMAKIIKEVQDIAMSLRMIPLKQTFQKMQRIARDTSTMLGKRVQLQLVGEETEVDKTVLENLSDPLVHIVRNAVDHGVELPADRAAKGKSEVGALTFKAYHQGGKLVIEVVDDGGGIDPDRLVLKAKEKGVLAPDAKLSRTEAINLIFHPGFSSKSEVTEISGRGVGMDVVRSNIERMNGEVSIETEVNKGSTFKITLPLTLAIIEGLVIVSNNNRFVVPLAHVTESVQIDPANVKHTTGLGDILLLRGETMPLVALSTLLGRPRSKDALTESIALILRNGREAVAVAIDDILSQQQIVIKKMGAELQHIRGFSGSSVLGDGRPALILELSDLLANYESKAANAAASARRISA